MLGLWLQLDMEIAPDCVVQADFTLFRRCSCPSVAGMTCVLPCWLENRFSQRQFWDFNSRDDKVQDILDYV